LPSAPASCDRMVTPLVDGAAARHRPLCPVDNAPFSLGAKRERHQQHVGYGRADHDPVDVAHRRSVALNARAVEREPRLEGLKR
jgi:hypothetical protein